MKRLIDIYQESERERILNNECPFETPWLERLIEDSFDEEYIRRNYTKNCLNMECFKCWNRKVKETEQM